MTVSNIWILGGYQSDFARNFTREELDFANLAEEVVNHTLDAAKVPATDIEVIHVGNAFGQLFAGQGQLGAMPATVHPDLWGVPSSRHEAACASGSIAVLAAMADLRAGNYDVALVMGIELEKTVPGDDAGRPSGRCSLGRTRRSGSKIHVAVHVRPCVEGVRGGVTGSTNLTFARSRRSTSQTRRTTPTRRHAVGRCPIYSGNAGGDDTTNPVVEGGVRRFDCSQVTDGGAGVVLVTDKYLREHPGATATPLAHIAGWGHRTVGLGLEQKLARDADNPYVMPHVRDAVMDAFSRAGVDLAGMDGIETHDCFTASEYLAIDHIGLTAPGESWKAIESGDIAMGGKLPINPSGGLIGGGHPVGASGVRMLLDAAHQVTGTAGGFQVEGASRFATLNFGGSTATTVSFVVDAVS